ncbi:adenosylcobinamide-phosphate synthase CbiB [Deltaproteobacteria bacterium TL4]
MLQSSAVILSGAFLLDIIWGDPVYPLHPVRIMGGLIQQLEQGLRRIQLSGYFGGFLLVLLMHTSVLGTYLLLGNLLQEYRWILELFLLYSCIAFKDLLEHANAVKAKLEAKDLAQAQDAVQKMIGRDAKQLDEPGVARATIESVAENYVDSYLAPLFWFTVGALITHPLGYNSLTGALSCVLFYRVSNTLDAMVGYQNERYQQFGFVSAKLDDYLNFMPARLGIPLLVLSAWFHKQDYKGAWVIGWRDRLKHKSPNSGHPESCIAGALNIQLGGPGIYPFGKVEKAWLGEGTKNVTLTHIQLSLQLISFSVYFSTALFVALLWLLA